MRNQISELKRCKVGGQKLKVTPANAGVHWMPAFASMTLFLLLTFNPQPVFPQQPQAQAGEPIFKVNAQYVNGIAPGYWPTKGAGLTLNISAGSVHCNGTVVEYAGGTLAMADATTNYVYWDGGASCAPAVDTIGFSATHVPIAKVVAASGAITAITDMRAFFGFQQPPTVVGKNLADEAGADWGAKVTTCGTAGGECDGRALGGAQSAASVVCIDHPTHLYLSEVAVSVSAKIRIASSNVEISGVRGLSKLTYAGIADTGGFISIGVDCSGTLLATSLTNVQLNGLTVNAASLVQNVIRFEACSKCGVENVEVLNANGGAGVAFYGGAVGGATESADNYVLNSYISGNNTTIAFGDGAYFSGQQRPVARGNVIVGPTRIGIVSEANGAVKSSDVDFSHNNIRGAHDATGGQSNCAIWSENTNGGRIAFNVGSDLSGGTQVAKSCGITIGSGASAASTFVIESNIMSGARNLYNLLGGSNVTVLARANSGVKGTLSAYDTGYNIVLNKRVQISGGYFDDNAFPSSASGTVVVSLAGATTAMQELSIDGLEIGMMDYSSAPTSNGDFLIFSNGSATGGSITHVRLHNLRNWTVVQRNMPDNEDIDGGGPYLFDGTTYNSLRTKGTLRVSNLELQETAGSAICGNIFASDTSIFTNVVFNPLKCFPVANGFARKMIFKNCDFFNGSFVSDQSTSGTGIFRFDGGSADEYDGTRGIFESHPTSSGAVQLYVHNFSVSKASDVAPFQVTGFAPNPWVISNSTRSSTVTRWTNLTTPSTLFLTGGTPIACTDVKPMKEGSMVYATSGGVTSGTDNTLACGSSGALAVRDSSVWRALNKQN
jgi:small nuclear ribonucleoprotein (snRNP)-like protein